MEFSFNQNIGIVEVIVSGPSGTSTVNCDTQDTYYVTVPVGSAPGFYWIDIIGPEYEGTGVGSAPGFYWIDIIGPEYEGTGSFWL